MSDWNWRFGKTPDFAHHMAERFDWGRMEVYIDTKAGKIEDIKIYSDSLVPEMVQSLMTDLKDVHYEPKSVQQALEGTKQKLPQDSEQIDQFSTWLQQQIQ